MSARHTDPRPARLADVLLPLCFLVSSLSLSVAWFGDDASSGPNQLALMLCACVTMVLALRRGYRWRALEQVIYDGMTVVFAPCLILLAVGVLVATWMAAGIVPAMIWLGLSLIHPDIFYVTACLVCALVSLSIGSSWTTAASIGVALIGTAQGLGLSPEITAGAVISGAYFGDKMSPLSETTNLASAVTGVELFAHIRHMVWTGGPALGISLLLFLLLGALSDPGASAAPAMLGALETHFSIHWFLGLPVLFLLLCAWRGMPALPAILLAALLGAGFALWQPGAAVDNLAELWWLMVQGYGSNTGEARLDALLSGGGAQSMLMTVWLILSAVFFGAALEKTGALGVLVGFILQWARSAGRLITATVLTGVGANLVTSDQYMAIVLPGRMFAPAYRQQGLAAVNLSRAIEDSATVTSPLVPWNTCGAFMAAALGVATFSYLPFCFFNLLMPLLSIAYGLTGFKCLPAADASPVASPRTGA